MAVRGSRLGGGARGSRTGEELLRPMAGCGHQPCLVGSRENPESLRAAGAQVLGEGTGLSSPKPMPLGSAAQFVQGELRATASFLKCIFKCALF